MYIALTFSLIVVTLFALWWANWDYLHPAFINSAVYLLSALGCLVALGSWIVEPLDYRAYVMIVGGTILFAIGSLVAFRGRDDVPVGIQYFVSWYERIDVKALLVIIGLLVLCCAVSKAEIISIGTSGRGLGVGEALSDIQQEAKWAANKDVMIEGHLWLSKITFPLSQCFVVLVPFMMALNVIKRHEMGILKPILLIISFGLIATNALVSGERIPIQLALSVFALSLVVLSKRSGVPDVLIIKRALGLMIPAFLGVAVLGYAALSLTGRRTDANIVDYISFYVGSGIPGLSEYFATGINFEPEVVGSATFKNLMSFLGRYFGDIITLEDATGNLWIDFGGGLQTNIFTRYFRYYLDFGWTGFVILTFLCGVFYGILYRVLLKTKSVLRWGLIMFFFSYLVDAGRQEAFCTLLAPFLLKFAIFLLLLVRGLPLISKWDDAK